MESYGLLELAVMLALYGVGILGFVLIVRPPRRKHVAKTSKPGRPPSAVKRWWTPSRVAIALGAGVPIVINLIVPVVAGLRLTGSWIWTAAIFMGLVALIGGMALAGRCFVSGTLSSDIQPLKKPAFDPEVFDFMDRRG
jgi:hypothetical protein